MIHGTVSIDANQIGYWQAVRMEHLESRFQESAYSYEVSWFDEVGTLYQYEGMVQHTYKNGWTVLLGLIMEDVAHQQTGSGDIPGPDS